MASLLDFRELEDNTWPIIQDQQANAPSKKLDVKIALDDITKSVHNNPTTARAIMNARRLKLQLPKLARALENTPTSPKNI